MAQHASLQQTRREIGSFSRWYCTRPRCDGKPHGPWQWKHARHTQRPPAGDWVVWFLRAGRGSGKSRSAAEWVHDRVRKGLATRIALIGRTVADVRDVMVEGPSGILKTCPPGMSVEYYPSIRRLVWSNGAQATTYTSEEPSQLRGPETNCIWADEVSSWVDAHKGDVVDTAWNNAMFGLRIDVPGDMPRCIVSSTPKQNKLTKAISERLSTKVVQLSTHENLENLAPAFAAEIISAYAGTRLEQQEIFGELLKDIEGALWSLDIIAEHRVWEAPPLEDFSRITIGVDPAVSTGENADATGIVVAGKTGDGHVYVLDDRSMKRAKPHEWARQVVSAFHDWQADRVVAEVNNGGDMVPATIHAIDRSVPVEIVHATRGKLVRAEPVAAAYHRGLVHHVGVFEELEAEMTSWVPDPQARGKDVAKSPDVMDSMVWSIVGLGVVGGGGGWDRVYSDEPVKDAQKKTRGWGSVYG